MTLAEFKRTIHGNTLTLVESFNLDPRRGWYETAHKYRDIPRTVRVRSADMILTTPEGSESYMQFGRASDWTIDGKTAVFEESDGEYGARLVYAIGGAE